MNASSGGPCRASSTGVREVSPVTGDDPPRRGSLNHMVMGFLHRPEGGTGRGAFPPSCAVRHGASRARIWWLVKPVAGRRFSPQSCPHEGGPPRSPRLPPRRRPITGGPPARGPRAAPSIRRHSRFAVRLPGCWPRIQTCFRWRSCGEPGSTATRAARARSTRWWLHCGRGWRAPFLVPSRSTWSRPVPALGAAAGHLWGT
jgi:hypothetical protein